MYETVSSKSAVFLRENTAFLETCFCCSRVTLTCLICFSFFLCSLTDNMYKCVWNTIHFLSTRPCSFFVVTYPWQAMLTMKNVIEKRQEKGPSDTCQKGEHIYCCVYLSAHTLLMQKQCTLSETELQNLHPCVVWKRSGFYLVSQIPLWGPYLENIGKVPTRKTEGWYSSSMVPTL